MLFYIIKYQDSMPCGFRQEDYSHVSLHTGKHYCKTCDPQGPFLAPGA